MRQVVFRKHARYELDEAGDWYEKERTGLGMEFLAEIHLLLQRIANTPEQFPMLYRDVRKAVAGASPTASTSANEINASSCWPYSTARGIQRYCSNEQDE